MTAQPRSNFQIFLTDSTRAKIGRLLYSLLAVCGLMALSVSAQVANTPSASASWTPLKNAAPANSVGTMMLLTDGTVFAQSGSDYRHWLRLTPDSHGSYVNGTWTTLAPMGMARLYFASQVLEDGRVWVLGGEYSGPYLSPNVTATGEIYDPVANSWSPIKPYPDEPGGCFPGLVLSDVKLKAGSPVISGIYSTVGMQAGWTITGNGIPAGATVVSVDSETKVTMSAKATLTGTSTAVQFIGILSACFGDDPSILLSRRRVLAGNILQNSTYFYSIDSNSWAPAANKVYNDPSDEEGWTSLRGGAMLNYDLFQSIITGQGYAELYHPSKNVWTSISPADGSAHGTLPVLSSTLLGYELGPELALQDGRALVIGANPHTALYKQATNTWAAGPDIIGTLSNPFGTIEHALFGADDAPAALMPNGHVLLAADAGPNPITEKGNTVTGSSVITNIPTTAGLQPYWGVAQASGNSDVIPQGTYITSIDSLHQIHISSSAAASKTGLRLTFGGVFSNPTELFDFDPHGDRISPVNPPLADPNLPYLPAYAARMLVLPNGQILFSDGAGGQLYAYTPEGSANPAYWPVIEKVEHDDGVFTLTGRQLNGPSDASAYGDDAQSNENYPIVRLQNSSGQVFYCRTRDWTSTGVGDITHESVKFTLNRSVRAGVYQLFVSAGGISSAPVSLRITEDEVRGD